MFNLIIHFFGVTSNLFSFCKSPTCQDCVMFSKNRTLTLLHVWPISPACLYGHGVQHGLLFFGSVILHGYSQCDSYHSDNMLFWTINPHTSAIFVNKEFQSLAITNLKMILCWFLLAVFIVLFFLFLWLSSVLRCLIFQFFCNVLYSSIWNYGLQCLLIQTK